MFSDERILTKEEQILSDEHYRYSNKMARKALYEVMPKAYRRFCDIVIMEAKNKKLKVLDLHDLQKRCGFTQIHHILLMKEIDILQR